MPNDLYTQQALASDPTFRTRVKGALLKQALVILAEAAPVQSDPPTQAEAAALNTWNVRRNYAFAVISGSDTEAARISSVLVHRVNVFNFTTSYDFTQGVVVTTSGDPDLESQIYADWNIWARA